ncbi:MAG: DUF3027 domain-containing protein [Nocardioidaceae bacterium]|nr:DUF3027 domain-containing protein [Nocardioidaceae bacterium]NUS53031.1 DUF3027 domain-containing protein [Nocardioidaceae bacterium]
MIAEAGTGTGTRTRTVRADAVGVGAVDAAREALLEAVDVVDVGAHLGHRVEAERVVTHFFECLSAGYKGWRWAVTVARASRQKAVTVDEIVLLPGDDAIVAPTWVPWRDRIQPGDLSPGDILPTEEDDPRLVPSYLTGDPGDWAGDWSDLGVPEDDEAYRAVADELSYGRPRVLSLEGRDLAAERWYDGSHGPTAPLAQSAPGSCGTCGFLVRLDGPLASMFGVCANAYANDDGRVVSFDHGCGAHSEAQLAKKNKPQPLPDPVLDTLTWDELDRF